MAKLARSFTFSRNALKQNITVSSEAGVNLSALKYDDIGAYNKLRDHISFIATLEREDNTCRITPVGDYYRSLYEKNGEDGWRRLITRAPWPNVIPSGTGAAVNSVATELGTKLSLFAKLSGLLWRIFAGNSISRSSSVPAGTVILIGLLLFVAVSAHGDDQETTPHLQAYIDAGYAASNLNPSNGTWRSKSTTATLNSPELFLAMASISKAAVPKSRWGFELGLQTGLDSENLVTSPPPASNEPVQNADSLRQLYRANVSYLFGEHGKFRLTGGLMNSYVGYESFLGIDNPNYTRTYLTDSVPFFLFGMEAAWKFRENIDLNFYLVSGYNYLAKPNDVPSGGMQINWSVSPKTSFTQNIYYGPDQGDTSLKYWRFLSDSIIEWRSDRFLVAAALDYVREQRADQPGEPVQQWTSGALWLRWALNKRFSFALRPEFFRDEDGLSSGARQTIRAYTATLKYEHNPSYQRLVAALELRYDESTGEQGGFYDSPNDRLVPHQSLILASVMWGFDR